MAALCCWKRAAPSTNPPSVAARIPLTTASSFLNGEGDIAGQEFRFEEKDLPSACKAFDGWLQFGPLPNLNEATELRNRLVPRAQ